MWKKIFMWFGGGVIVVLVATGWWLSTPDIPHEELRKRYGQSPSQFLKLPDGANAHYRDRGPKSAPLVLLLHGSNASLHTWEGWVKALTPTYRVITVDLPGHGLTGKVPSGDYSYQGMIKFLHGFVKTLGLKRFILGGNSMGGALSWKYTLAHPKQVERLILVDAAGVPRPKNGKIPLGFKIAKIPVIRQIARYITPRSLVEEGLKRCYGDPSKATAKKIDLYYDLTLHPGNRMAMIQRFSGYRLVNKVPPLSKINVPTLILWGAKDTVTPPPMAKIFHEHIKGAKLIIYPKLGHIPMEEAPARTAKDVLAFLTASAAKAVTGANGSNAAKAPPRTAAPASPREPTPTKRPATR